jgi:hypothetical protein
MNMSEDERERIRLRYILDRTSTRNRHNIARYVGSTMA